MLAFLRWPFFARLRGYLIVAPLIPPAIIAEKITPHISDIAGVIRAGIFFGLLALEVLVLWKLLVVWKPLNRLFH